MDCVKEIEHNIMDNKQHSHEHKRDSSFQQQSKIKHNNKQQTNSINI